MILEHALLSIRPGEEAYERWRGLLHHFYEPFPEVEHFSKVWL